MNTEPTPIASALLIITPPLAALAAWSVPRLLTLAEHPLGWLAGIAAAAVAITTLAAVAEAQRDPVRIAWPLLLAWPLAFPFYMNQRHRLGSGVAGALLLCGALAWSGWQVQRGEDAAAFLLQATSINSGQASGEENHAPPSGEAKISEAERQRLIQQRIDAILDAEEAQQH